MRIFIPIVSLIAFFGCTQNPESITSSQMAHGQPTGTMTFVDANVYQNDNAQRIKTADYRFQARNVKNSSTAIEEAILRYPAFISSSQLSAEDGMTESRITIRVKSDYFDQLLKEIDKEAIIIHHRNISTKDVSKEFVDLESRIDTKREVEARYIEILRSKAGTINELLEAEEQIGSLHEEIEATVRKLNYLKDQVSYSTINLEFYQSHAMDSNVGEEILSYAEFSQAFKGGLSMLIGTLLLIISVWPLTLFALVIAVLYIRKRKKISMPSF
jgi:hypothetical protein